MAMKVIACFATSWDGKIGPPETSHYVRLSSDEDIHHLKTLRDQADALLFGGETFRAYPKAHTGLDKELGGKSKLPLHCILTRRFDLPPEAPYFQNNPPVPTLVCAPEEAPDSLKSHYPSQVEWLATGSEKPIRLILDHLASRGVQTVLLEGGGQIFNACLREHAVDELYLTLCPLLIGGNMNTPALLGSLNLPANETVRLQLLSVKPVADELFLHAKLHYT